MVYYAAIALVSAASLLLELALLRLFAVQQFYHFAFMAISLALLGAGASGSLLSLWPRPLRPAWSSLGFSVSILGAYLLINTLPFDSFSVAWDRRQPFFLALYFLAAAVELVHEMGADEMVMFTSFDLAALAMVRELDPNLRVGILDWYEPGGRFDLLDVAISEQFYAWSPKAEFATEDRIRRASEAGLHVFTGFGSTSPGPHQGALLSWGLQGFSTNIPEAFVDYLKAHGLR